MRSFLALLSFALTIATLLYMGQEPDPPARVAELISGLPSKDGSRCDVANLDTLRHAAIVYTDKEMGELKYSMRSLLKFAPWLEGPIYIVTPGQIPDWLDLSNPRVRVVDQDDLLPKGKATLPTFDTNVIEQYLHKIPGLTDVFIHMNDDYLFIKPVTPDRFFTVRNTVMLTDRTYGGEHVYNFLKHAPFVYSRLAFEEIHHKFGKELDAMLPHQMRHPDDLNMPLLHHIYMQEEGTKVLGIPVELNPISESAPEPAFFELPEGQHVSVVSNWHGADCAYDPNVIPLPEPDFISLRAMEEGADWAPTPTLTRFRSPNERAFAEMTPSFAWNLALNIGYGFGLATAAVISVYIFRFSSKGTPGLHATKQT
ncbi:hypothetical protein PRIC1_002348 [Phytophthora ramorum]